MAVSRAGWGSYLRCVTVPNELDEDYESYATLPRYLDKQGKELRLKVWCIFCVVWHTHGAEPVGSITHRAAHCYAPDSLHRLNGGYLIEVSDIPFSTVKKKVKEATPTQGDDIREGRITETIAKLRSQIPPFGW